MTAFTESIVEDAALAWLEALGYAVLHSPDISPGGDALTPALSRWEREKYSDVVLERRLRQALVGFNPDLPAEALEDAFRKSQGALSGILYANRNLLSGFAEYVH